MDQQTKTLVIQLDALGQILGPRKENINSPKFSSDVHVCGGKHTPTCTSYEHSHTQIFLKDLENCSYIFGKSFLKRKYFYMRKCFRQQSCSKIKNNSKIETKRIKKKIIKLTTKCLCHKRYLEKKTEKWCTMSELTTVSKAQCTMSELTTVNKAWCTMSDLTTVNKGRCMMSELTIVKGQT